MTKPLLSVENLSVTFNTPKGLVEAVRGVSFDVGQERLGIVGESGSGKSQTGRAILGLTPGKVSADRIEFDGIDLHDAPARIMRDIRGQRISMIMQDPRYSLNPVMTVGWQIAEAYRVHTNASNKEAKDRALDMLKTVRIREPQKVYGLYPHQVSGGMGQRIMIAMMLIPRPDLLIADEPTSALDVSVQAQVLDLIDELVRDKGMGLILISHDLNLVARYCDRILVMHAGEVVESCAAEDLHKATHPYTQGLLAAVPRMEETREELPVLDRSAWSGT